MKVKIYWEVEFYDAYDNDIITGFDLIEVSDEEFESIFDVADEWLNDCINEKIARSEGYPDNHLRLPKFFNTINISSGINDCKIKKYEEIK